MNSGTGAHRAHHTAYRKGDLRDTDSLNNLTVNQGRTELNIQPTGKAASGIQTAQYNQEETTGIQTTSLQPGGLDLRDTDSFTAV
jgi:hypothetical protein